MTWIQVPTLKELLDLKVQHPEAKLVVGNTEIGKGPGRPRGLPGGLGPPEGPWTLEFLQNSQLWSHTDLVQPLVGCVLSEKLLLVPCPHFPISSMGLITPPPRGVWVLTGIFADCSS